MKELFIKDLRKDMEVVEFFMVKSVGIKVGSNSKQYLDITLGDSTGEVTAKKWDVSESEYPALAALKEKDIVIISLCFIQYKYPGFPLQSQAAVHQLKLHIL